MSIHRKRSDPENVQASPRIVIIGSGMSGMLMAIRLLNAGHRNFILCEKRAEVGGVWRDNTYPGLKCDIPALMYSYSFERNAEYSNRFATGQEIRQYLKHVAEKHGLEAFTRFNHSIVEASFREGRWVLITQDQQMIKADIVVWAGGVLHNPSVPVFPGADTFQGESFHSSQWPKDLCLKGKRVGIIGSGSTSVQIVSAISEEVGSLTVFQRTPHWIFPLFNRRYSEREKQWIAKSSRYALLIRWAYVMLFQWTFARAVTGNRLLQRLIQWQCEFFLRRKVKNPILRKKLRPDFKAGCKRLVLARGFYEAIQRKNATLCCDAIRRIDVGGVVTNDGVKHELDILVYATGFQAHQFMRPMKMYGQGGASLDSLWTDGPFAHRSVALPGMPNFFMLIGPQSPTGNFSAISVAEVQADYVMKLIDEIASRRHDFVEPKSEVCEALTAKINVAMKRTVWMSGCQSWYIDDKGKTSMWPWTFERFKSDMRTPDWSEFRLSTRSTVPAPPVADDVKVEFQRFAKVRKIKAARPECRVVKP